MSYFAAEHLHFTFLDRSAMLFFWAAPFCVPPRKTVSQIAPKKLGGARVLPGDPRPSTRRKHPRCKVSRAGFPFRVEG